MKNRIPGITGKFSTKRRWGLHEDLNLVGALRTQSDELSLKEIASKYIGWFDEREEDGLVQRMRQIIRLANDKHSGLGEKRDKELLEAIEKHDKGNE